MEYKTINGIARKVINWDIDGKEVRADIEGAIAVDYLECEGVMYKVNQNYYDMGNGNSFLNLEAV